MAHIRIVVMVMVAEMRLLLERVLVLAVGSDCDRCEL